MATIREGNKAILLILDVQVGVMPGAWEGHRTVENIGIALDKARARGVPVVWVQHAADHLAHGSTEWQIVPELVPAEGDTRIEKGYNSAFAQSPLEEALERLGATRIVLAGAATNWCIRATAYAALDRGYDLTLVADAHTTHTTELEDGRRVEAADVIRELNATLPNLSYPGLAIRTVAAAEVGSVFEESAG